MRQVLFSGRVLPATFVVLSLWTAPALAAYEDIILADKPIGYWRFEETTGTTAADSSGNDNEGFYEPGVTLGAVGAASIGGFSAEFDGSTGYVDLEGFWGGEEEATVEAWVNPSGITGDFQSIVSGHDPNSFVHFQLHSGGNTGAYTDGGFIATPIIPVEPIGVWRHVAMVVEPGDSRVYVDGELFGDPNPGNYSFINESENVDIGLGHVSTRWFLGLIDEVAIYDYALSQEQLQAHINAAMGVAGDVNGDSNVSILDYEIIRDHFRIGTRREEGDLSGDGTVDLRDFGIWKKEFEAVAAQAVSDVPEPDTLSLLLCGLLFMFFTRSPRTSGVMRTTCHVVRSRF